jgi:hypothetical protein
MRDLLNTSFQRSAGFFDNLNRGHHRAGAVLLCGSQKYPASEHERRVRCRAEKVSEFGACRHAHNLATPRQTVWSKQLTPRIDVRPLWCGNENPPDVDHRAGSRVGRMRRSAEAAPFGQVQGSLVTARICSFSLFSPRWSRSTTQALEQPSIAIQWLPSRPATVRLEAHNFWLKTATSATFPTKENPPG